MKSVCPFAFDFNYDFPNKFADYDKKDRRNQEQHGREIDGQRVTSIFGARLRWMPS